MNSRKFISFLYIILALAGGIIPTLSNIQFMKNYGPGFNVDLFINMANNNPAAQSLSSDLLIGASAIILWIIVESRRLKMKHLWIVLLSSITIAFAFAAPLFLYLRERRLIELESE